MRSFTNIHELLCPVVTHFTTAYLTLQSIQKQKQGERFSIDFEVKKVYMCMERMLDYEERFTMDIQLDSYDQLKGEFRFQIAMNSRKLRSLTDWLMRFGGQTPELTKFSIRVLSLTCSSSVVK
uniref:Uncharacterized protein n=1 Tax=Solanum lycopersicum TaxID=4081 RepID=K4AV30_SOLLC